MATARTLAIDRSTERSTDRPTDDPTEDLSLDVVFGLLSNRRRRLVLHYLLAGSGSSTLSDLAEHVAAVETGKEPRTLDSDERKRAYIALYQSHLPKLDDAGVVEFDDRGAVELADRVDRIERYLTLE